MERFLNDLATNFPWLCVAFAFVLGGIVGSYLNVCIIRMPLEKSIFWPGSRCSSCLSPVRWYDNLPLISYWRLGGKCRVCGETFSARYFWIEFLSGLCFAGLFYLVVMENIHSVGEIVRPHSVRNLQKWQLMVIWIYDAFLVSCLLVATFTDIDHWEIPLGITIPGTLFALVMGTLFPWPWPVDMGEIARMPAIPQPWERLPFGGIGVGTDFLMPVPAGLQRWPVFMPVPEWASFIVPGTWTMGLATALLGAAFGALGMRLIRLIFSWGLRKEAMGLGDADLMMMIGAFLGWQSIVLVLGLAVLLGLVYAVVLIVRAKGSELPFGPFLAGGALLAVVVPYWYPVFQVLFFDLGLVLIVGGFGTVLALCLTLAMRMIRIIWDAA